MALAYLSSEELLSKLTEPGLELSEEEKRKFKDMDFRAALVLLPVIFREKVDIYVTIGVGQDEPATPYPSVQILGTFDWKQVFSEKRIFSTVKMEGSEICQAVGVEDGVLSAFCAYFVFNLAYSLHNRNTLLFLQRHVLKASCTVYRKHRTHIWPNERNVTGEVEVDISDSEVNISDSEVNIDNTDNEVNNDIAEDASEDVVPNMNDLLTNFRANLISFVLKCREKNILPQSVQQEILDNVKFPFSFFKENYDSLLICHIKLNGFNIEDIPELVGHLQSFDFFC
ncbi:hypothetical protein IRJ41_013872 [Triplophysa rosa]|uniref:Uncharacterized protein n=1 Tax=Triplophysa rosa TaxID=992332 RepID=A0A9W7WRC1_TRIRA|nr:hypothetical protein IRJ41_013872 [Triplophysa rosa]